MTVFITGASGFIGTSLALRLAREGHIVHALYRDEEKAKALHHERIRLFKGDILDPGSISIAIKYCSQVYHIAAFTEVWAKNPQTIYDLNVKGSYHVFEAAQRENIKDIVFTSTAGILGPSLKGPVHEKSARVMEYFLEYERTKAIAENIALKFVAKGLNIRIVNPTRVFGPGLLSKSNSVTIMIGAYAKGLWRIIPGNGKSIGNYAFIDDVVNGHILAMEHGKAGERYVLGGENIDYIHFFKTLGRITGKKRIMAKFPLWLMLFITHIAMFLNRVFGVKPFMTPRLARKFNYNWNVSSQKAIDTLGYTITPIEEGMIKTLKWLNQTEKSNDREKLLPDNRRLAGNRQGIGQGMCIAQNEYPDSGPSGGRIGQNGQ